MAIKSIRPTRWRTSVPEYIVKGACPENPLCGDTTYKVITDHLGSVRLVVNTLTNEIVQKINYTAFGNIDYVLRNDDWLDLGFVGGLYDKDTKLTRFGARDYDPIIGRWTSKDPIGFSGGVSNLYEYCVNDPVNRIDPYGEQSLTDVRDFTAGVISNLSFGLTDLLFESMGDLGKTNPCSDYYSAGEWTGTVAGLALGGKAFGNFAKGKFFNLKNTPGFEFRFSKDFRIGWHKLPNGRTLPHYHRRPGIGKHRPWEGGW